MRTILAAAVLAASIVVAATTPAPSRSAEEPDPKFYIFLCLGQSNMEGFPTPEAQDRVENPRVKVLAYDNCADTGRTYNEWYTAAPPLHSCRQAVGPGDYFGKTPRHERSRPAINPAGAAPPALSVVKSARA